MIGRATCTKGVFNAVPRFILLAAYHAAETYNSFTMANEKPQSRQMNSWAKASAYMGLAFVIPAAMYACWWVGVWANHRFALKYLDVVGLMLGFAAGLYELFRTANRIEKGPKS